MQLRGTWSALTSYKCIIWRFKHKTLSTDIYKKIYMKIDFKCEINRQQVAARHG